MGVVAVCCPRQLRHPLCRGRPLGRLAYRLPRLRPSLYVHSPRCGYLLGRAAVAFILHFYLHVDIIFEKRLLYVSVGVCLLLCYYGAFILGTDTDRRVRGLHHRSWRGAGSILRSRCSSQVCRITLCSNHSRFERRSAPVNSCSAWPALHAGRSLRLWYSAARAPFASLSARLEVVASLAEIASAPNAR